MPIFEYKCPKCKYQFELILKEPLQYRPCPNCKTDAKRIPTAASFKMRPLKDHPNEPDVVQQGARDRKARRQGK